MVRGGGPIIPGSGKNRMQLIKEISSSTGLDLKKSEDVFKAVSAATGGPILPADGSVEVGPFTEPLSRLYRMVKEGSITLAASPVDLRSAKELKALKQELAKHDINIDLSQVKMKKLPTLRASKQGK
jgi:hypothetical protein